MTLEFLQTTDQFRSCQALRKFAKNVNSILSTFLEQNDRLHPSQTGFRPQQGTETALLAVVEESRKSLDVGGSAAIVLLDLSAAFDTVNHQLLIKRLREIGVSGSLLNWLESFLRDRSFQVFKDNCISQRTSLHCGVPQGSSLSPTLFCVYLRPLAEVVEPFGVRIISYADDTQLIVSLNHLDNNQYSLANCLERVSAWMDASFLKLNPAKTVLVFLGKVGNIDPSVLWPQCLDAMPPPH